MDGHREPDRVRLDRVRRVARLLDTALGIPGTRIRFGLDSVLGLLPGGGDVAGAALSALLVLTAARWGAPAPVLARMILNLALDAVLGALPVVGDLVDVGWKANMRNVSLLERWLGAPDASPRPSPAKVLAVGSLLLVLLGAMGWAAWAVTSALLGWLL